MCCLFLLNTANVTNTLKLKKRKLPKTMECNLTFFISESNKKQILIHCKLPTFLKKLFI